MGGFPVFGTVKHIIRVVGKPADIIHLRQFQNGKCISRLTIMGIDCIKARGIKNKVITAAAHGTDFFQLIVVFHDCHQPGDPALHRRLINHARIGNARLRHCIPAVAHHKGHRPSGADFLFHIFPGKVTFHHSLGNDFFFRFDFLRLHNPRFLRGNCSHLCGRFRRRTGRLLLFLPTASCQQQRQQNCKKQCCRPLFQNCSPSPVLICRCQGHLIPAPAWPPSVPPRPSPYDHIPAGAADCGQ